MTETYAVDGKVDICGHLFKQETEQEIFTCTRPKHHPGSHSFDVDMPARVQPAKPWPRPAAPLAERPSPSRHASPPTGVVEAAQHMMESWMPYTNEQTKIGATGATSSHAVSTRYDMISREFLKCLGDRFAHGEKHGRFNYRKGLTDKQFILDRVAHMYDHIHRLFQPVPGDEESFLDNVGAAAWGLSFLCEVYATEAGRRVIESLLRPGVGEDVADKR